MHSKKSAKRQAPPCAELHDEDGVDPRKYFSRSDAPRKPDRKALQLCRQVQDALNYVLSGDSGDDLLALFEVIEVRPAPNASQLLAIVAPAVTLAEPVDAADVLQRLQTAQGRLRAAVAAAITRKAAPRLMYQIALASLSATSSLSPSATPPPTSSATPSGPSPTSTLPPPAETDNSIGGQP